MVLPIRWQGWSLSMYGNCLYCGVFAKVNRLNICNPCHAVDEQLLQQARETLDRQGPLTVFELAENLSIPPERVFLWLQNGFLPSRFFKYNCPLCGSDLLNGFCQCDKKTYTGPQTGKPEKTPERFYSTRKLDSRRNGYWDRVSKIQKRQRRDIWLFEKA